MLVKIREMLLENSLCVLCTVSGNLPYCSLMTYVLSDDFKTLYMVTVRESRKYRNLLENPKMSLLIDSRQNLLGTSAEVVSSITFEGVLKHLEPVETDLARGKLVEGHGELKEILRDPDCVIFGVELKTFLLLNGPVDAVQGSI